MTVLGDAVARSWGECAWTARDLLKAGVTINDVHPGPPEPPRLVVIYGGHDWSSDGEMVRRW